MLEFRKLIPSYAKVANEILCLWKSFCQRKLNEQEIETLIGVTKNIVEKI